MKLSTAFNILSVTTLAIANASAANAARRRGVRGETGTRDLKPKSKVGKKGSGLIEKNFDVRLEAGATYSIFEHGPIEVFVNCNMYGVSISAVVTNDSEENGLGTFGRRFGKKGGFLAFINVLDSYEEKYLWLVSDSGIDRSGEVAVSTSTGYYVGLDTDTAIGLHQQESDDADKRATLAAYGDNVKCVFVGRFHMSFNKPGEVIEAQPTPAPTLAPTPTPMVKR
jgi:hypothetical protein